MCIENFCPDYKISNTCKDGEWSHNFKVTDDFLEDPAVICDDCGLLIPMFVMNADGCALEIQVQHAA